MELNLYNLNISCILSTLNLHSNIYFILSTFEKWLELLFNAIPTGSATHIITQLVALKVTIFKQLLYILDCFLYVSRLPKILYTVIKSNLLLYICYLLIMSVINVSNKIYTARCQTINQCLDLLFCITSVFNHADLWIYHVIIIGIYPRWSSVILNNFEVYVHYDILYYYDMLKTCSIIRFRFFTQNIWLSKHLIILKSNLFCYCDICCTKTIVWCDTFMNILSFIFLKMYYWLITDSYSNANYYMMCNINSQFILLMVFLNSKRLIAVSFSFVNQFFIMMYVCYDINLLNIKAQNCILNICNFKHFYDG